MQFDLKEAVPVLERTPATLQSLLGGLPEPWVRQNEGGESWSPFDVVGHLIDGEETDWIPRARIILSRSGQPFVPFDRFAHKSKNRGSTLAQLLDTFTRLRQENLETLRGFKLQPADLSLPGVHPELGAVTLGQLLATWVVHDLGHIAQVARVMAHQYDGEVAVWKQYLPVLTRR
ncbi:MAG TPA: DinB family protein [Gemmatimonadales bacterium]|nr:DinB family protein [Gemmatimonadales bacterium]